MKDLLRGVGVGLGHRVGVPSRPKRGSRPLNPSIYDGDVLVRVDGDEERCVTSGIFEEGPGGAYGWRAVPPPGADWTLDREASARKGFSRHLLATAACPLSGKADTGADIAEWPSLTPQQTFCSPQ